MNTAYAQHEICGDYLTAILKWFEGGAAEDLNALAEVGGLLGQVV